MSEFIVCLNCGGTFNDYNRGFECCDTPMRKESAPVIDTRSIAMDAYVDATLELAIHYRSSPHNQNDCAVCREYVANIKELLEKTLEAPKFIDLSSIDVSRCWRCDTVIDDDHARYCDDCADAISNDRWEDDRREDNRCGVCGDSVAMHDALACITSDAIGRSYY